MTLPRYALRHPDGRWLYYLPQPEHRPGARTELFADGDPTLRLVPLTATQPDWHALDYHAEQITAVYQPEPKTVGYTLTDRSALSERYPATLSVEEWHQRGREEDWKLYDRVTEDREPVEYTYQGPFTVLEGREPPAPGEPQWRADLPHELIQRPEYRHLFPGRIPGLKQYLEQQIKALPRVEYCFIDYQDTPGLHVTLRVPFDRPRTRFVPYTGCNGRALKSGRIVPVLVNRSLDLPVPAAVSGPDYETALAEWHRQVDYWLAQVTEASVAVCSACDGKGYITPHAEASPASEARARLSAYLTHDTDAAEFEQHLDAVVTAETAPLQQKIDRVRAWATGHEYGWLHELLDGYGTHGGHL